MALVEAAVELVIADGECAVPQFNDHGGVDVWKGSQAGYVTRNGQTYFAEGVRIATDDNQIHVIKFVGNQLLDTKITITMGSISAELLADIIGGLL